jgi:hypothetical protein
MLMANSMRNKPELMNKTLFLNFTEESNKSEEYRSAVYDKWMAWEVLVLWI